MRLANVLVSDPLMVDITQWRTRWGTIAATFIDAPFCKLFLKFVKAFYKLLPCLVFVQFFEVWAAVIDLSMNIVNFIGVSWQCMPERSVNFFVFFRYVIWGCCDYGSIIASLVTTGASLVAEVVIWYWFLVWCSVGRAVVGTLRSSYAAFELRRGH